MTRKWLVVPVLLAVLLAGCSPATPVAPVATAVPVAPEPFAGKTFYWLAAVNGDPFYIAGKAGWDAAAKDLGVQVKFVGPLDASLSEHNKIFEQLIADPNTAGILLYLMDFNAERPLVEEAQAKGIPVIIANTDSPFPRLGFVGTDHAQVGRSAAAIAAKAIGCKGSVGTIGNDSVVVPLRMKSFDEEMAKLCPDVEIVPMQTYHDAATQILATVDSYMIAHPDLTLLWFADGSSNKEIGPWRERIQAGSKTLFLGADMPKVALEAVKDGTWVGTVGQDTYSEEYWGLTYLVFAAQGKPVPDVTFVGAMNVTKDNVDQYLK
jgi:ABC-type sugar transport system substrate-binding protein